MSKTTKTIIGVLIAAAVSVLGIVSRDCLGEEPAPVAEDQPDGTGEASP
jgi:hypothetical protein